MPNSLTISKANVTDTLATLDQVEADAKPHFTGYRSRCYIESGALVVSLRVGDSREASETLAQLSPHGKLQCNRARLLGEAMCHAINSGMTPEELVEIAQGMANFATNNPFIYRGDPPVIGMLVDNYPSVRYVLMDEKPGYVQVVRPDIRTTTQTVKEVATDAGR